MFGIALVAVIFALFVPVGWFSPDPTVEVSLARLFSQKLVGQVPGDSDSAEFRVELKVTPRGGDIYIDAAPSQSPDGGGGFVWSLSPDSSAGGIRADGAVVTPSGPTLPLDGVGATRCFQVPDGVTRGFSLNVRVSALADNVAAGLRVDALRWRPSPSSSPRILRLDPDEFQSDLISGLSVR